MKLFRSILTFYHVWLFSVFALCSQGIFAQPVLSTKREIGEFGVYQDHIQKHLWYYNPPEVLLKRNLSGAPAFILLQMRYTGTKLFGDADQKGFHTILQLTIELEPMPTTVFDEIKATLGRGTMLKPLPVSRFLGELIIPLGDADAANEKYRKVTMSGVEASGSGGSNAFWQERTFTMQLDNHESQLLWDQMESGKLGVSFSYAFYAEAMPGEIAKLNASGSTSEFEEAFEGSKEELTFDDKVNTYLVKANTFPIYIHERDFAECLKKVDVNEEMPPAYASFEVRCYDFADDLRPDLFKKIVEIKAYAAGKDYITTKADFSINSRDVPSRVARFPYAIRLDHPLEYRVTEINVNGEMTISPWVSKTNWAEVIDITTTQSSNQIGKRSLDFELDLDSLQTGQISEVVCEIRYKLNKNEILQSLTWKQGDDQPLKSISFSFDKASPISYRVVKKTPDQQPVKSPFIIIREAIDYYFLNLSSS